MQFNLFLVLGLIGSAMAAPSKLEVRDTKIIDASIKRIGESLNRLEAAFLTRPAGGDARQAAFETDKLVSLNRECVEQIRSSSRDIRRGPNVNTFEALNLYKSVDTMTKLLTRIVDGWKSSKKMVDAAGKKAVVLDELMTASEASQQFADALISKLPLVDQALAEGFKKQHYKLLETAVTVYKKK